MGKPVPLLKFKVYSKNVLTKPIMGFVKQALLDLTRFDFTSMSILNADDKKCFMGKNGSLLSQLLMVVFLCFQSLSSYSQQHKPKNSQKTTLTKDIWRVNKCLADGYGQLQQYANNSTGLDSAIILSKLASSLSLKIGYRKGMDDAALLQGRILLANGDLLAARAKLKKLEKPSQIGLLLSMAQQAIKIKRTKQTADSAFAYLNMAEVIAKSLKSVEQELLVKSQFGLIQLTAGDVDKGFEICNQVIAVYDARGNEIMIGRLLVKMALNIPPVPKYYNEVVYFADRAIKIYEKLNRIDTVGIMAIRKSNVYSLQFKNSLAEKELLRAIEIFKVTKNSYLVDAYVNITDIYKNYGDNEKALASIIESINAASYFKKNQSLDMIYQRLGALYLAMGQLDKAIAAYQLAFDIIKKKSSLALGEALILTRSIAEVMGKKGKVKEALDFIDEMEKKYPPQPGPEQSVLPMIRGSLYAKLGRNDIAEKYYLQAVSIGEKLGPLFKNNAIVQAGNFYQRMGQFEKSKPYFEILKNLPSGMIPATAQKNVQYALFRIDSAEGKFASAMVYYQQFKYINDTIFNGINNRRYQELQVKYETDKKDRDILLKQKNIEILQKQDLLQKTMLSETSLQMRLNQQEREKEIKVFELENERKDRDFTVFRLLAKEKDANINRLKMETKLQQSLLAQEKVTKKLTFGSIVLLAIIVALLFSRYRIKQRANKLLNAQKEEISQQNFSLQELVTKQESLIIEKEWLLKEIHHRVKNNLQIVISLLRAQTDYLDNDIALSALKQSQHRMHAMSMIHQRLYQSESMSCINIEDYMKEMVSYFSDSMDKDKRITFVTDALPLSLNIGQAIPLGLILNEAITNSIKYAFENTMAPRITISLLAAGEDELELIIADNGKGLDKGFEPEHAQSLGMSMIFGLSEQLGGTCNLINNDGLHITVNFKGNLTSGETSYLSVLAS